MYVSNNKAASLEFGKVPNEICIPTGDDDVQRECYMPGQQHSVGVSLIYGTADKTLRLANRRENP